MFKFKAKKNDYREKITLILGVFIGGAAVILFFIDLPTVKNIKTIKDEIAFQRFDLEKKYFKIQGLKKTALSLNKIEAEMAGMNNIFINKNRELEFITQLEKLAADNSLSQKISLTDGEGRKEGELRVAYLNIELAGSYGNIMHYLSDLESADYYINFSLLELASGGDGDQYRLSLKALTYWGLL